MKLEKIKELYKDYLPDQRATLDQLKDLYKVAIYLKMYDAADFLFLHVRGINSDYAKQYEYELKRRKKHG